MTAMSPGSNYSSTSSNTSSTASHYSLAGACCDNHRNSWSDICYHEQSNSPSLEPIPLSPLNAVVHTARYTHELHLPTPGPSTLLPSSLSDLLTSSNTSENLIGQQKKTISNHVSLQLEQIIWSNGQLRDQVQDLLGNVIPQLLATLLVIPLNNTLDTFLAVLKELDETMYPHVTFWHHSQWKAVEKEEKEKEKEGRGERGLSRHKNGNPVSGDRISAMGDYAQCLFHEFALAGYVSSGSWERLAIFLKIWFFYFFRILFPELRLCFGNWKTEHYAKVTFAGWWQARGKDYVDILQVKPTKLEEKPTDMEVLDLTAAVTSVAILICPTSKSQVRGAKRAQFDSVPSCGSLTSASTSTASGQLNSSLSGNSSEEVAPPKKKLKHSASQ
ncbi:hypothetical protein E1B28_011864 [Marasmius oreades]|uniref:Uncharacterized protein n=1 Tax=Marasmius oreades TaxID=181124 RepID=A0A9P7RV59_9AGAR|nr:uncharacterized protein E1B28_011864 [Marasmius oreades]KAG7090267.1 hypothetical protein E1B28_011864 [Marasmius oreades]